MRFESIRIGSFGRIRDLETGPEALTDLVVVAGPNEAGKSTFFRCLTALLYGFSPASREQNPDTPWDGSEAEGWARIRTDDGEMLEIRRRLLSSPWGRVLRDGREEDVRNAPLPLVERLPLTVFRQVFALTLSEVAALEASDWAEVQDRLVSAMGARDLLSARDVAARLEEEAGALWRPSRRGNQEVRLLSEEIRRIEGERDEAMARDREIRSLVDEVDRTAEALKTLEEERAGIERLEGRVRRLLPVHQQLVRIGELEQRAGDPAELESVPTDPAERLAALRERAESLAARTQEIDGLLNGIRENERRADSLARDLFGRGWTEAVRDTVRGVAAGALRERVREWNEARDARRIAEAGQAVAPAPPRRDRRLPLALLVGGGVLVIVGLGLGRPLLAGAGLVALAAGAWLLRATAPIPPGEEPGSRLEMFRSTEREARRRLSAVMAALPLIREVAEEPTLELPALVQRLQELDRDLAGQRRLAEELAPPGSPAPDARIQGQLSLLPDFDAPAAGAGADPAAPGGDEVSGKGASSRVESEAHPEPLRAVTARLVSTRDGIRNELSQTQAHRASLEGRLARLGGGDPDRGAEIAVERFAARRAALELSRDLSRNQPDLAAVRAEIEQAVRAAEPWTRDAQAATSLQRRRVELTRRIEATGRDLERSRHVLERLQTLPTADRIDGQALVLRRRRFELARERDRLVLLARLVREADRRFREERQPRILARAGRYLDHVTGGRYGEVITADQGGREVFKLRGRAHPHPVSLDRGVSTGTREQAYLALRLAAVEELDAGGERLPVFVDEVFVNWDSERRQRGLELLGRVSSSRQVFVFTCHGDVAGALEELGGHTVLMEDGQLRTLEGAR